MEKEKVERTKTFRWNSKEELYTYFEDKYAVCKDEIDTIIAQTMKRFRPRKHQVIKTQELWEKVGKFLEKEHA